MARSDNQAKSGGTATLEEEPQVQSEPKPPYPKQKLEKPGLEAEMELKPQWRAPKYKAAGKLEGKVALVTGADSGIGRAVAYLYAREGADVAIVYLPEEESDARETAQAVQSEGRRAVLLPGDVTSSEFCQAAVEETVNQLGQIDIVVNNAAFQKNQESLDDVSEEQWDKTFKTNIYGYFYMV